MVAHVHVFGETTFDVAVSEAFTVFIVCFYWCWADLWVLCFVEADSEVRADLAIVEGACYFRFCGAGDDVFDDGDLGMEGSIGFWIGLGFFGVDDFVTEIEVSCDPAASVLGYEVGCVGIAPELHVGCDVSDAGFGVSSAVIEEVVDVSFGGFCRAGLILGDCIEGREHCGVDGACIEETASDNLLDEVFQFFVEVR